MEEPNILIKTALNDAVQKVNSGLSPTAALKKVAEDLDLNPNYIQRAGEALNVALHYKHFKTASDRSSDFEIADIPEVIKDVFTKTEKTASEYVSDNFSEAKVEDVVFNYNRALSNPVYKKAYLEISEAKETNSYYPTTFRTVYEKAANHVDKLAKQNENALTEKLAAEFDLNAKFSNLADEFKKDAAYRASFEEFESQVFSKHGEACVPYLDLLHKTACPNEDRGVHDSGYIMFNPCKEASLFAELMEAARTMLTAEKQASDISETLKYEQDYLKEAHKLLGKQAEKDSEVDHLSPSNKTKKDAETEDKEEEDCEECDPVLAAVKKKANDATYKVAIDYSSDPVLKEAMEKEAFFNIGSIMNTSKMLGKLVEKHDPLTESFSHVVSNQEIGHRPNSTLDNMERKLLLQELMITDPILSKVNPAKVARAFEQLLRLSPEISKEKEVVRAELRAMVSSQALSTHDADLLSKTDLGMLKRRMATDAYHSGATSMFRL